MKKQKSKQKSKHEEGIIPHLYDKDGRAYVFLINPTSGKPQKIYIDDIMKETFGDTSGTWNRPPKED